MYVSYTLNTQLLFTDDIQGFLKHRRNQLRWKFLPEMKNPKWLLREKYMFNLSKYTTWVRFQFIKN